MDRATLKKAITRELIAAGLRDKLVFQCDIGNCAEVDQLWEDLRGQVTPNSPEEENDLIDQISNRVRNEISCAVAEICEAHGLEPPE